MIAELVLATGNAGKVREIRQVLDGLGLSLPSLADLAAVAEPEETGRTFAENARVKASAYAESLGRIVVAEDSGLEIDALDGVPGVRSARFGLPDALTYPEKFELIYRMLRERTGRVDSTARFVCALAVAEPPDASSTGRGGAAPRFVFEASGTVEGRIVAPPRGTGGFGYDPIFYYPPFEQTLAEASPDRKAAVSHRGRAFRKLREQVLVRMNPR